MTTSVHSATATTPRPTTVPPSLAARIIGIVRRPRSTFEAVLAAPRWADVLIVSTVAAAAARALVMQTDVGRLALVDQWERTALAFGRGVDDAAYAALQTWSSHAGLYEVGMALLNGPVATFVVAIGIFLAGGGRARASFRQVLSLVAHASVILALRQIVGAATTYFRETTASATTLGSWFPGFDEASAIARFLGAIDLFVVWWAVVLGVAIATAYGFRVRRGLAVVLGTYVVGALVMTVVMIALGGRAS